MTPAEIVGMIEGARRRPEMYAATVTELASLLFGVFIGSHPDVRRVIAAWSGGGPTVPQFDDHGAACDHALRAVDALWPQGDATERRQRPCGYRGCTEPAYRCDACGAEGCDDALRKSCTCDGGPDASPLYESATAQPAGGAADIDAVRARIRERLAQGREPKPAEAPSDHAAAAAEIEALLDADDREGFVLPVGDECFREGDDASRLRNLLATIHRDGGHYTEAVGVAQSCRDAVAVVLPLLQRGDAPAPPDLLDADDAREVIAATVDQVTEALGLTAPAREVALQLDQHVANLAARLKRVSTERNASAAAEEALEAALVAYNSLRFYVDLGTCPWAERIAARACFDEAAERLRVVLAARAERGGGR